MNLILLESPEVDGAEQAVLRGPRARHIHTVLKTPPGSTVRIGLLDGPLGTGRVEETGPERAVLRCRFDAAPPPRPTLDLLLALPRPKVMKRLWPQLAALGVGRIVLVRAAKVERFYFDSHVLEPGFYRNLLIQGLQQARCTHLPDVLVRHRFKPFVEDELDAMVAGRAKLLADPSGRQRLRDVLEAFEKPDGKVLAVGPEGGWSAYEREKLQAHGFRIFGMGSRILRTDTACIALVAALASRWDP